MHKCHNYHAIIHKLYTWFGKNELKLYLNGAKISSIGGGGPRGPLLNTPMAIVYRSLIDASGLPSLVHEVYVINIHVDGRHI